jgi:S-adenosylmethionine-diacylgycerolhomoserine-N-methlytransferase
LSGTIEAAPSDIRERMERMYRPQRLIYDLSRKYYLFGRDELLATLAARPGERLVDVGCGTGRNLEAIAHRYPGVALYGLDAANVMLETTQRRFARQRLTPPRLVRASAEALDLPAFFGIETVEHVLFSYSLSMMDQPALALERAAAALAPGGRLHVVDFGPMDGLPRPLAGMLRGWLRRFSVHHRPEIAPCLRQCAQLHGGTVSRRRLRGGYAEIIRLERSRDRA